MLQCWELEPGKRPPFSEIVQSLSISLESMAGYMTLDQHSSESEGHKPTPSTTAANL